MKTQREIRAAACPELRDLTDAEKKAGYVAAIEGVIPYNSDSEPLGGWGRDDDDDGFIERIAQDAFKRSLDEGDEIIAYAGHTQDPNSAFGRSGVNLTFSSDSKALRWRALVPDTTAGRDLVTNIGHGIIRGTSFEFSVRDGGDQWLAEGDQAVRIVTDARLYTVNPVATPAYSESELTVSLRTAAKNVREAANAPAQQPISHDADWDERRREAILVSPVVIQTNER